MKKFKFKKTVVGLTSLSIALGAGVPHFYAMADEERVVTADNELEAGDGEHEGDKDTAPVTSERDGTSIDKPNLETPEKPIIEGEEDPKDEEEPAPTPPKDNRMVTAKVFDQYNNPIQGATVTLSTGVSMVTGASGIVSFAGLSEGTYSAEVTAVPVNEYLYTAPGSLSAELIGDTTEGTLTFILSVTANKDELKSNIDLAGKKVVDRSKYTKDSFSAMYKSLEEAIAVFNKQDASVEEVKVANSNLLKGINGLVLKSDDTEKPIEPTEPSKPTEPTKPSEPSKPTEPTKPTEPIKPTEPTEPTDDKKDDDKKIVIDINLNNIPAPAPEVPSDPINAEIPKPKPVTLSNSPERIRRVLEQSKGGLQTKTESTEAKEAEKELEVPKTGEAAAMSQFGFGILSSILALVTGKKLGRKETE